MNAMPKYVVSTTLKELTWKNSTLLQGDVAEAVRKLKTAAGGDILVHGSGTLAQTLMEHDLIDEYRLMVHPTMLGIGGRLYRDIGERKKLKLIDTKVFRSGTVVLEYRPVG
jgi:dihydrofolate reductase